MFSCRGRVLTCALSFALVACATGNNRQLTELQTELRAERELLKVTRAEMQAVIKQLEPMLVFAEFVANNREILDLAEEPPGSESTISRHVDETDTEGAAKAGDTETRLTRSEADAILADPMAYASGSRIVPSIKNGQPNGFKLYAIRPASFYAKIGLMNGDTVHSINGLELTSPDTALEAYTKLKGATTLAVSLTRRGQPVTLTIHID